MSEGPFIVEPIGRVESPLVDRDQAPLQGDEGAPDAWLVFEPGMREALRNLQVVAWNGPIRPWIASLPTGSNTVTSKPSSLRRRTERVWL